MKKLIASTDFFNLYEVTQNMYAAIKTNDLCMSNAGFINLGDRVLVYDTFLSIEAAKEFKNLIIKITGNENIIIVNSHSHVDHLLGNCVFPQQTPIITSKPAYEKMKEYAKEIQFGVEYYQDEIKNLQDQLTMTENADEKLDLENSLIIYQNLSHEEGKVFLPNITFTEKLKINGLMDNVTLKVIKKAHSPGDIICTNEEGKAAFVGDLLFVDEHPMVGQGDPYLLIKELRLLLDSDIEYFIPGHGPICGKEKIVEQIEYIEAIITLVKNNIDKAATLKATDLPQKFHHYKGPSFRWNINFLAEYLQ